MYDVFISYRRNGGEHTAKIIRDRLTELGYDVFFDVESLRSGNFNEKLYSVIDECKDFVLVLSPGALDRCINEDDWVRKEVEHAISQNKNIVPVMMRDFTFGCPLPQSMEKLPYLNGIEANSQFFDAFIAKLQQFLKSRPSVMQRIKNNVIIKKTFPLIIALAVVGVSAFGIKIWYDSAHSLYPSTKKEINILNEVVYKVSISLTKLDIMLGAEEAAYNAALRYLQSDTKDEKLLQRELSVSKESIMGVSENTDNSQSDFTDFLYDSPYNVADVKAFADAVGTQKNYSIDRINYIEYVLSPERLYTNEEKLQIVECYKAINEERMKIYAYSTNHLFLPVTDRDALKEFFEITLPGLENIPLSEATWLSSVTSIETAQKEADNKIRSLDTQHAMIVGNSAVALNEDKKRLQESKKQEINKQKEPVNVNEKEIEEYNAAVAEVAKKEEKKEVLLEEIDEKKNKIREMCEPMETDTADRLWFKMGHLLYNDFYNEADVCIDMYEQKTTDTYAQVYLPVLKKYVDRVKTNREKGGIMIADYEFPDSSENVFQVGDIIVSFNGESCRSHTEYTDYKASKESDTYNVGVLRMNDAGEFEETDLILKDGVPRVLMYDIMYWPETQEGE